MNQINNWFQEARRTRNNAIGRKDAIKQHAGKPDAVATHVLNLDGNLLAHPCTQIVGFQPERVRGRNHAHGLAHGNAFTDRRGETRDQSRIAVVRFAGNDNSLAACIKLSAAHRQVIGLRTRAHEHYAIDFFGHSRKQVLGIVQDVLMHIASMRIQQLQLTSNRFGDCRIAMAHRGNVVIHIKVLGTIGVEQARSLAAHQVQWFLVKQAIARAQHRSTLNQALQIAFQRINIGNVETVRFKDANVFTLATHFLPLT